MMNNYFRYSISTAPGTDSSISFVDGAVRHNAGISSGAIAVPYSRRHGRDHLRNRERGELRNASRQRAYRCSHSADSDAFRSCLRTTVDRLKMSPSPASEKRLYLVVTHGEVSMKINVDASVVNALMRALAVTSRSRGVFCCEQLITPARWPEVMASSSQRAGSAAQCVSSKIIVIIESAKRSQGASRYQRQSASEATRCGHGYTIWPVDGRHRPAEVAVLTNRHRSGEAQRYESVGDKAMVIIGRRVAPAKSPSIIYQRSRA